MDILITLLVVFFSCTLGKICGMGGGVIIKPALNAIGRMDITAIDFMSGCAVIGMSLYAVVRSFAKKEKSIDTGVAVPLALGAALGGVGGKLLFSSLISGLPSSSHVAGIQAAVLFFLTLGTLLYTAFKEKLPSYHVRRFLPSILIGLALGMLGSFLGIGGGPFNMAALFFFFSMDVKTAAMNSLFIILLSQTAGMILLAVTGGIPVIAPLLLVGVILAAIAGSETGSRIGGLISAKTTSKLLMGAMALVMLICVYNFAKAF